MKICHIITSLGNGGAEKNLVRLCLKQSQKNKITIIILKNNNFFKKILKNKKIKVINFNFDYTFKILQNYISFIKTLNRENPNVIFSWMFHASIISSIFTLTKNVKLIWCIRHGNFNFMKTKIITLIIGKYIMPLISFIPDKIIYNSKFSKNYYEKLGYRKKKTKVIFNGFSKKLFKPNIKLQNKFKKKYKIKKDQIIFGYVARFNPQKNHYFLFNGLKELKNKYGLSFKIILIGGRVKNNKQLSNIIKNFSLTKETIILSETDKINLIYPIFDVNFLVSSYGESFPNTLAESMLCGVPCISSNTGDSKSIIGNNGYLFENENQTKFLNCIHKCIKDFRNKYIWNKIKVNCRKSIINRFDIINMEKKYELIV